MDEAEVLRILEEALRRLEANDRHLLENDLSERCIAARLAVYMQPAFDGWSVDVEYNRKGDTPKRLGLPRECLKKKDLEDEENNGDALVVPDVIVHRRGPEGPNLLVLELKKTTNRVARDCDRLRVDAFRAQLGYTFGATIECETRTGRRPTAQITAWVA
jgi:hypothetical protein